MQQVDRLLVNRRLFLTTQRTGSGITTASAIVPAALVRSIVAAPAAATTPVVTTHRARFGGGVETACMSSRGSRTARRRPAASAGFRPRAAGGHGPGSATLFEYDSLRAAVRPPPRGAKQLRILRHPRPGRPQAGPSEDCLYLNVWTKGLRRRRPKRPVMVWIHGGGYDQGSGGSHQDTEEAPGPG